MYILNKLQTWDKNICTMMAAILSFKNICQHLNIFFVPHVFGLLSIISFIIYIIYEICPHRPLQIDNPHEIATTKNNPVSFIVGSKTRKLLKFLKNLIVHLEPVYIEMLSNAHLFFV